MLQALLVCLRAYQTLVTCLAVRLPVEPSAAQFRSQSLLHNSFFVGRLVEFLSSKWKVFCEGKPYNKPHTVKAALCLAYKSILTSRQLFVELIEFNHNTNFQLFESCEFRQHEEHSAFVFGPSTTFCTLHHFTSGTNARPCKRLTAFVTPRGRSELLTACAFSFEQLLLRFG